MSKESFNRLFNTIDEALEGASNFIDEAMDGAEAAFSNYVRAPVYNTTVLDDCFIVELAVPGYEADDVNITIADNDLVVVAEPSSSNKLATFGSQPVRHQIQLPRRVLTGTVEASYLNGVIRAKFELSESDIKVALVDCEKEAEQK